jgi:hypothetical protein
MTNERSRQAVEEIERFADGEATNAEIVATATAIFQKVMNASEDYPGGSTGWMLAAAAGNPGGVAAGWVTDWAIGTAGWLAAYAAFHAATQAARLVRQATRNVQERLDPVQAGFLRDIFGNPFRPVVLDHAWLAWNGGAVAKPAQAAYDQRSFPSGELDPARLAVLADALEDSGCDNREMLTHLRGPGPHVRGCWVVDLLLGKS